MRRHKATPRQRRLLAGSVSPGGTSEGYGDCLLISCLVGRRTWRLLIDTGPDECLPTLVNRLKAIPSLAFGGRDGVTGPEQLVEMPSKRGAKASGAIRLS